MTIVELILAESAGERRRLIAAASVAGVVNVLLIALASGIASGAWTSWLLAWPLFIAGIAIYAVCARWTYHRSVAILEAAVLRIKKRLVDKIGQVQLAEFERIGTSEIYDRVTTNTAVISGVASITAALLQSASVLLFACLYVLLLSPPAFALIALLLWLFVQVYRLRYREANAYLARMAAVRLDFLDRLTDLMRGFKETKFSRARSEAVQDAIVDTSDELRTITIQYNDIFNINGILTNFTQFALIAAILFVLPAHVAIDTTTTGYLVAGIMLLWSPVSTMVLAIPAYTRSNQALRDIEVLEGKLDATSIDAAVADDPWGGAFRTIELRALQFTYPRAGDDPGFGVGPIDLTLHAGEVVFIVGGNGSGKSTLLKALTGLYAPTCGGIYVDGQSVTPANVAAYRALFTTIYTDFHLFSRLYGIAGADEAAVRPRLEQMQLADQTAFVDRRFTRRSLSTGQRKRLAMIVALLEDRPIFVFDEWAADQDPEFRRYFYVELLPALRAAGKLVLAVSHDDRYFGHADRVVTLDLGRVRAS